MSLMDIATTVLTYQVTGATVVWGVVGVVLLWGFILACQER